MGFLAPHRSRQSVDIVTEANVNMWVNDFFAAIVTVGSVTIFTKFMTHRTRKNKGEVNLCAHIWRGIVHTMCVSASLFAMGFALWGLAKGHESQWLEIVAATTLLGALLILIIDGVADDFRRRPINQP
jgi:heme/copper-type cytochrome/quinol oxidase subunit 3